MKVDFHIGLTFQVGPASSNQYGKLDITFSEIDTEAPIEPQLESGKAAAKKAFIAALEELTSELQTLSETIKIGVRV